MFLLIGLKKLVLILRIELRPTARNVDQMGQPQWEEQVSKFCLQSLLVTVQCNVTQCTCTCDISYG